MRRLLVIVMAALTLTFPGRGYAQRLDGSLNGPASVWGGTPLRLGKTMPVRIPWTRTDIALAGAFTVTLLMDASQTRGLARGGWQGFREANPLLGRTPSVGRINVYTAVAGVTILGAAAALPARVRPWFLRAAFVIEAFTVARNAQAGIAIRMP